MTPELADYVRETTLREPEALRRLRLETEDHPRASLQIAPEQGQFLHLLALAAGARRALEVGVFMGYSSTWVALALPEGGRLVACDLSEEYAARARRTWREAGVEEKIELRMGPALDTLDALLAEGQAGQFDFAFIDADKGTTGATTSGRWRCCAGAAWWPRTMCCGGARWPAPARGTRIPRSCARSTASCTRIRAWPSAWLPWAMG